MSTLDSHNTPKTLKVLEHQSKSVKQCIKQREVIMTNPTSCTSSIGFGWKEWKDYRKLTSGLQEGKQVQYYNLVRKKTTEQNQTVCCTPLEQKRESQLLNKTSL